MVRFTDDANRFWLEQSLDKGEMPKRDKPTFFGAPYSEPDGEPSGIELALFSRLTELGMPVYFRPNPSHELPTIIVEYHRR